MQVIRPKVVPVDNDVAGLEWSIGDIDALAVLIAVIDGFAEDVGDV